ncbi:MAG TPA: two-component regulator propeller domain-containing protein, partial [Marinilabiliaceae bacterium]|nr:two-component regulator propeller domain-containing protein [Marinilabiliaceae bacterium]
MLWVETTEAGISKIDLTTGKVRRYQQQLDVSSDVRAYAQCGLMVDEKQTLWLTLKGGGFGYYNEITDEVDYFFNRPGDPHRKVSNFVNCFYKDSTGVLWMSTYFKGVEKVIFTEQHFRWVEPAPQMDLSTSNEVRALMEDSYGLLWVATKNQEVFLLDKNYHVLKSFTHIEGKKIGRVYALLEDSKGTVYLGTKGNGLFQLHRNGQKDFSITHYLHDPTNQFSISNSNIYSILEDKNGDIWIGTYGGGVNVFKENRFYHSGNQLKNYPKLAGRKIRHIIQDYSGSVWIASTEGLLLVDSIPKNIENISFRLYNRESGNVTGMRSNDVFWLLNDRQNNIWMASLGGGLAKLDKSSSRKNQHLDFSAFTMKEGLSSDVIFTMVDDEEGNLWMATENGISSFAPDSNTFKNYQQYDGAVHPSFSEGAITVRADGSICFGSNNGLYSFQPSSFEMGKKRADIVFTGFKLFGQEVVPSDSSVLHRSITETKSIKLKHHQNVFFISWAGLDFNPQNTMQYACKLEGYDTHWRDLKDRTSVDYHMVPPGEYLFCVKFTNPELQEMSEMAFLSVEISPPFWRTPWAYLIYFLILVLLLEIARRVITTVIKLRNKIEVEKGLTEAKLSFFTNISHELRTPLTLMLGPVKEIKQKETLSQKGKVYADLIETNAQRLLRLVNQLLDFRKIQSREVSLNLTQVDLVALVKSICVNFEEKANQEKIHFLFDTQSPSLFVPVDEEKLESVIINLLSNAFKFTDDNGSIKVRLIQPSKNDVIVEVVDNGVGIS